MKTIGTSKLEKIFVIVFHIYLSQLNKSRCIFEGIFQEFEITKSFIPSKLDPQRASAQKWKMIRMMYEDQKKRSISTHSNWVLFLSLKKQLIIAVKPRQVKSGVLWAKSIRDETADTTGIFNSVSVSIGLSDQDLRILRRQLGQAKWNKNMLLFFKSYLVNSKTDLFFRGYFWWTRDNKRHQNNLSNQNWTLAEHQPKLKSD